jgi:hypothetical protein
MYIAPQELDGSSLLQGDVLRDIHLLGALHYSEIFLSTPASGGDPQGWTVPKPPLLGDAVVLSHSCEVARENGVKLTSIILAPLRDVSSATRPDKLDELIASNLIDSSNPTASYLKYFYLEAHHALKYTKGSVIDFSKLFSVRKNSYDYLLSRKVLQLTESTRDSMALKLALYFHRSQESCAA